jgi:glucokinase
VTHGKSSIGIDLGATNIKAALVSAGGRILIRGAMETSARGGPRVVADQIAALVTHLSATAPGERSRVRGVGVGCPGLVDSGVVRTPPNLAGWDEVPLQAMLESLLDLPVKIENDVNAVTLGELRHGAGRGYRDFVCITLGTGLGGGIVLGGKLYRGPIGSAGELGHVTIKYDGPRCRCGNRGCLERYVGAEYIMRRAADKIKAKWRNGEMAKRTETPTTQHRARRRIGSVSIDLTRLDKSQLGQLTVEIIGRAARAGDPIAIETLRETGELIGVGMASVVNILNPELIIVGGGVARAGRVLLDPIRQEIRRRAFPFPGRFVRVVRSALGDDAGVLGAATLV